MSWVSNRVSKSHKTRLSVSESSQPVNTIRGNLLVQLHLLYDRYKHRESETRKFIITKSNKYSQKLYFSRTSVYTAPFDTIRLNFQGNDTVKNLRNDFISYLTVNFFTLHLFRVTKINDSEIKSDRSR